MYVSLRLVCVIFIYTDGNSVKKFVELCVPVFNVIKRVLFQVIIMNSREYPIRFPVVTGGSTLPTMNKRIYISFKV